MYINQDTAILSSGITLVPYEICHVPAYHEWMKDPDIQESTASEPLSLEDEYAMQRSWRADADKLTFIACLPSTTLTQHDVVAQGDLDSPCHMIGDVNLFLTTSDLPGTCVGELELMIAPLAQRRKGYGRATIISFLHYISVRLPSILAEFAGKEGVEKMTLGQLRVKIGESNERSIGLFESIGFVKTVDEPNYFGEFELEFDGIFNQKKTEEMLEKWGIESWKEIRYIKDKSS